MKKLLIFFFIISSITIAQNPKWINYINSKTITAIRIENNFIWVTTTEGLIKLNKTGNILSSYDTTNSSLPTDNLQAITLDVKGNKWIGTFGGGLVKFNDSTWIVYNTSNSGLPNNSICSISIDSVGNKWIGTFGGGLIKFDDTIWTVYNTSNAGLPDNNVLSINIDKNDNKWIGTYGGLAKFDNVKWTIYNSTNSSLPQNYVLTIAIDKNSSKWIGTDGKGLAKFDGNTWTVYNDSNSSLPGNYVYAIVIDSNGNKWLGTNNGLAVFNENGIVTKIDKHDNPIPTNFALSQNYPNPFNPVTAINYLLPKSGLVTIKIYDLLGREIRTLVNTEKSAGNYSVQFSGGNLSSGIYFYRMRSGNFSQTKKLILLK